MWGPDGTLQDTKALIPDRSYAGIYQQVFECCKTHGAFDVTTMGNVSNVGLMAKKAEEYGSHDKTFIMTADGVIRVSDDTGRLIFEHPVGQGDIWRMPDQGCGGEGLGPPWGGTCQAHGKSGCILAG